jgi:hypothetical protein
MLENKMNKIDPNTDKVHGFNVKKYSKSRGPAGEYFHYIEDKSHETCNVCFMRLMWLTRCIYSENLEFRRSGAQPLRPIS